MKNKIKNFMMFSCMLFVFSCKNGDVKMETYYDRNNEYLMEEYFVDKKTNLKNGKYYRYEITGLLEREGKFGNGKKEGKWVTYVGGDKSEVEYYVDGILNGPYESFFGDGKTMFKGIYKNGKQEGKWETFNPDGTLFLYEVIKGDSLIETVFVNKD